MMAEGCVGYPFPCPVLNFIYVKFIRLGYIKKHLNIYFINNDIIIFPYLFIPSLIALVTLYMSPSFFPITSFPELLYEYLSIPKSLPILHDLPLCVLYIPISLDISIVQILSSRM